MCAVIPFRLGRPPERHRSSMKTSQFGTDVGLSGSDPISSGTCLMPLPISATPKRHRGRTMTSPFAADDRPILNKTIRVGDFPVATAAGCPTEELS